MQTPIRKPGKYTHIKPDPYITEEKFLELENQIIRLKKYRPNLINEVKRLAEMGDFSENAAYQIAKGKLRGLNQKIIDIENHLKIAVLIKKSKTKNTVSLGSVITVQVDNILNTYQILGSSETNPSKGIISHNSPIGLALLGKQCGDIVELKLPAKTVRYKIIKIE